MKKIYSFLFFCSITLMSGQSEDFHKKQIATFYNEALTQGKAYHWLDHLSNQIGGRLSGSLSAARAVEWGKESLEALTLDKVWLQDIMVPKWVRGTFEYASIETSPGNSINVPICALGGSVATPAYGLRAKVLEVKSFEELEKLGEEKVKGKIVFFNRPMEADLISTFDAYSKSVFQRTKGAYRAAKLGAIGAIVRSMNLRLDDYPHTGSMYYYDLPNKKRIPAAAISTKGAELLHTMLALNPNLYFYFKQDCKNYPEVLSHNVIAEIKGFKYPNQIILIGGHLDSWDLGDGAHDDGAGIVQSMEVLHLFRKVNYQPKHTIRVVLFMNEENGLNGGKAYAKLASTNNEKHLFALESDAGGFAPRGFTFEATPSQFKKIKSWTSYFEPYLTNYFIQNGSGADIEQLKNGTTVLAGLVPDSQRYFDYHHASNDTFDAINKRELELGAAAMTSLVYLVDQFGF